MNELDHIAAFVLAIIISLVVLASIVLAGLGYADSLGGL